MGTSLQGRAKGALPGVSGIASDPGETLLYSFGHMVESRLILPITEAPGTLKHTLFKYLIFQTIPPSALG